LERNASGELVVNIVEDIPLMGNYMASIDLHENIYSFVILISSMHRQKYPNYIFTKGAVIAFLLFALNVVLQLALTTIAGGYILAADKEFISEVLPVEQQPELLYLMSEPWRAFTSKATDTYDRLEHEATRHFNLTKVMSECCVGADCAYFGTECCPPGVKASPVPVEMLQKSKVGRRKPSGKAANAKGRMDGSGSALRSSGPICSLYMDHVDCTQPSFDFIDAWEDLDTNGDGTWTYAEAQADVANLGCRFGVSTDEVFRSVCRGVALDIADTGAYVSGGDKYRVPNEIASCTEVSKQYFDYWKGLVAICAAPGRDQCGQLLLQGTFDGLLLFGKEGFARGGVIDLDSALDYCQRILTTSGLCERTLPVSYSMHMHRLRDKCGTAMYAANTRYQSPVDSTDVTGLVTVNYSNLRQYTAARGVTFNLFVACILFVWYLTLIRELKAIMWLTDFSWNFPGMDNQDGEDQKPMSVREMLRQIYGEAQETANKFMRLEGPKNQTIVRKRKESHQQRSKDDVGTQDAAGPILAADAHGSKTEAEQQDPPEDSDSEDSEVPVKTGVSYGAASESKEAEFRGLAYITRGTRCMCFVVVLVRFWLMWYMGIVGTIFTLSTYSYDELLMNAVALAFIFELPELLFMWMVSSKDKKELGSLGPLLYVSKLAKMGSWQRFLFSRYFWGLVVIPILCYIIVTNNHSLVVVPMQEALECACLQTGPRCLAAEQINSEWWAEYWSLHSAWPREVWLSAAGTR